MTKHFLAGADVAQRSAWFAGRVRPVQEGVYERRAGRDGSAPRYACWNGRIWNADAADPRAAARSRTPSTMQHVAWRGLAEPSGQPCATCAGHTIVDRGHDEEKGVDLLSECPDC